MAVDFLELDAGAEGAFGTFRVRHGGLLSAGPFSCHCRAAGRSRYGRTLFHPTRTIPAPTAGGNRSGRRADPGSRVPEPRGLSPSASLGESQPVPTLLAPSPTWPRFLRGLPRSAAFATDRPP